MATIAFLPTENSINIYAAEVELNHQFLVISPPTDTKWVPHVALELVHKASAVDDLILIFTGETAKYAPAIGFSRRSIRKPAVGYVLIDPVLPKVGGEYSDWPDAKVIVVQTDIESASSKDCSFQAKLRGWEVNTNSVQSALINLFS